MAYNHGVEYLAGHDGIAEKVRCPLISDWIEPIICLENQGVKEACIPEMFKKLPNWKEICQQCPFRDY